MNRVGETESRGATYEVVLPGEFAAPYLAMFARYGARGATVSSTFWCRVPHEQDMHDVAALLQRRGLVILEIRELRPPASRTA
jgi:hypothetical protein